VAVGLYDRLSLNIEEGEEKLKTIGKKREWKGEFQHSVLFSALMTIARDIVFRVTDTHISNEADAPLRPSLKSLHIYDYSIRHRI
jgi:hypothetical protein